MIADNDWLYSSGNFCGMELFNREESVLESELCTVKYIPPLLDFESPAIIGQLLGPNKFNLIYKQCTELSLRLSGVKWAKPPPQVAGATKTTHPRGCRSHQDPTGPCAWKGNNKHHQIRSQPPEGWGTMAHPPPNRTPNHPANHSIPSNPHRRQTPHPRTSQRLPMAQGTSHDEQGPAQCWTSPHHVRHQ